MLNLIEKLNLLHSTDKPHKKPQNHNENQIIVETNPVNNIHVEAPMITTIIGHPIVEQVPGLIEFFFFVENNQKFGNFFFDFIVNSILSFSI